MDQLPLEGPSKPFFRSSPGSLLQKEIEQTYSTFKSYDRVMEDSLRTLRELSVISPSSTFAEVLLVIMKPEWGFLAMQIEDWGLRGFTLDGSIYYIDII